MINSLRKRLAVYLILPVALLLAATGFAGFLYARDALLDQWQEGAILRLQRAAHYMDMRLNDPIEWIRMFHVAGQRRGEPVVREFILNRIRDLEGVTGVDLDWENNSGRPGHTGMHGMGMGQGMMMGFHRGRIARVTGPRYDAGQQAETVTLVSELRSEEGHLVGTLSVSVRFDYLMQDIKELGWWQSDQACLVDKTGRYLAHTAAMKGRLRLGATGEPLEKALLEKMQEKPFGTHLGTGHPPHLVGGFYRLKRAPWVLVMYAPGRQILAPIVEFRFYYALAAAFCIIFTLLLIRFVGGRMVGRVRQISRAVQQMADGKYPSKLPKTANDEIGQLEAGFNDMVEGLRERDFIRDTFGRYVDREVAHELMKSPEARRLGGEKREVVILMADIRGFTGISESLRPEEIIRVLNQYFAHMIEVIQKHRGVIVDFYGDGLLVFFEPPDGMIPNAAERAVQCSLEMQQEMERLNQQWAAENLPALQVGIGVNAGQVVVGNIGSSARAKYGIVGMPVNVTQRMQAEAGRGEIVLSESVYNLLAGRLVIKKSFYAHFKGMKEEAKIFFLTDLQAPRQS